MLMSSKYPSKRPSKASDKYEIYILGDMNIDFLKYTTHLQTEDYLDMLYSNSFLPVITKPTRITTHTATLIDHIYTNTTAEAISGIGVIDISDHLPIFCIVDVSINHPRSKIHFRDIIPTLAMNYIGKILMQLTGMLLLVQTPTSIIRPIV